MAKKRLSVWMRLWIVLTILWLIVVSLGVFGYMTSEDMEGATARRELCEFMKADGLRAASTDCWAEYSRESSSIYSGNGERFIGSLAFASIIAALAWLLGGIGYRTVKWILAGRTVTDAHVAAETRE